MKQKITLKDKKLRKQKNGKFNNIYNADEINKTYQCKTII
jgi:hypothetical protein